MLIPSSVEDLHEAYAFFDKAACEQTVRGKCARLLGIISVELVCFRRFFREIHQIGNARLETVRHFVLLDSSGDFGVAELSELKMIELGNDIQYLAARHSVDSVRVFQKEDGVALAAKRNALMFARQESRAPQTREDRLGVRPRAPSGVQNDVGGQ